ncbi:hypothetical protein [Arsenophonus sp. PmNCSU2021_1]|uniref:hypothetical protein n=1 Tax=Arsenophonus sp. PmNCSU2021_1 TaxID=3118989 RepID=UPI002FEE9B31
MQEIQAIRGARGGKISHGGGRPIIATSIEQLKPWEALGIKNKPISDNSPEGWF